MGHLVTSQAKKMITRKITIITLIAGIVLGAAATEGFNVYRQSHDSRIFQERAHCKAIADSYVKENTDLNDNNVMGRSVTLEKVDYSPARNSCVAELETVYFAPRVATEFESVEDLISGETLFSARCTEDCAALKFVFVNRAFDYVMKNADEPRDLEKEYVDVQSVLKSKTQSHPAPTPGDKDKWDQFQIDPATGERVQVQNAVPTSKSPAKSAPSSGR